MLLTLARIPAAPVTGILLCLTQTAPSIAGTDAALETCAAWMAEVREVLATEPPLRDEAYTAIMWDRLAAERAQAAGEGDACLAALDFPRRILGLHKRSPTESDD